MFRSHLPLAVIFLISSLLVKPVQACEVDCVEQHSWAVGVGLGVGEFENPLFDGKDRNVVVLPSFYYYGEKFYIENTELGYVFVETDDWLFKFKGKFNNDGLYYNDSIVDDLIVAGAFGPGNFEEPEESVSSGDVDRDLSYMAGIAGDYFVYDNFKLSVGVYHDVSGVHDGYSISAGSQYVWQQDNWFLAAGIGAEFLDSDLNQYYYGLRPEDETIYGSFNVGSNSNVIGNFSLSYKINKHFSVIGRYQYKWLGSQMTVSPLVEDDSTSFFFIGISSQFGSN
ncbi:MipA/OmpV family protein [Thalassotalea fonticola]|uniref:MipA/OmpV family protein n=1 Tax=Thalassotalea fonticola TaxID=3065649 RepID=A0ABZ0GRN5_9GAMM|nr:MipA/OmpV family protein [Colwelliaceae bacterium S1-1]